MIFARLSQRWHVLRYWREHQSLSRLELVRRLAAAPDDALFHHMGRDDYLTRGMGASERVRCVLSHYRFEDATFNGAYQQAVYGGAGIALWQHDADDASFTIRLEAAPRHEPQGDLSVALIADGKVLHRLSWSWVEGALFGIDLPVIPFVSHNAGRWSEAGAAFEAFERVFPNNSPSFFCFAALQGVAQSLGIDRVVAVRGAAHVGYDAARDKEFENAYDGFWRILGGVEKDAGSYLVPLPFYLKPLQDMPSKHRKRAALRREQWRAIGDSARSTVLRHMVSLAAKPAVTQTASAAAEA